MLLHQTTPRAKCPTIKYNQNSCSKHCENMSVIFSSDTLNESSLIEITRDHSFLSILGLLNEFVLSVIILYLI